MMRKKFILIGYCSLFLTAWKGCKDKIPSPKKEPTADALKKSSNSWGNRESKDKGKQDAGYRNNNEFFNTNGEHRDDLSKTNNNFLPEDFFEDEFFGADYLEGFCNKNEENGQCEDTYSDSSSACRNNNINPPEPTLDREMEQYIKRDLYKDLDILPQATPEDIKKAYRKQLLQHHPDRHSEKSPEEKKENEEKCQEITKANACLSDPQKRALYDDRYRPTA